VRPWRVAIAVLLLVLAAFAAILAADVRGWRATMRAGDAQFAVSPADANWA